MVGTQFSIQPASIKLGPPRIVRELTALGSATLGGYPYTSLPQILRAEALDPVCESLLDPKRPFPVVLVSHELGTERPLVDVDRLAAGLAGLMRVYELADSEYKEVRNLCLNALENAGSPTADLACTLQPEEIDPAQVFRLTESRVRQSREVAMESLLEVLCAVSAQKLLGGWAICLE